jgi:hypothetical protein
LRNRKRKWFIFFGLVVGLEVLAWFYAFELEQQFHRVVDDLRYCYAVEKVAFKTAQLAGLGSQDCGFVAIGQDAKRTSDCALRLFNQQKPFRAWYEIRGKDSLLIFGLAYNSKRELTMVTLDYMGGSDTDPNWFACPEPQQLYVSYKNRVDCRPGYAEIKNSEAAE